MQNLEIVQGAARSWTLQALDDFGNPPAGYGATDPLAASCWAGQNQGALFAPSAAWTDAATATFTVSITAAQSATLAPGGVYQLQVFRTPAAGGDPQCLAWVTLTGLPAAGSATQTTSTYCLDTDLLALAPWLEDLMEDTSDTEGYYEQRYRARQWLDRVIVSRARPLAYIYSIMTPLTPWGPVEAPNYVIQGYLQANYLLVRDSTIEIVARKAIALICEKQVSLDPNDSWRSRAAYWHRTAHNRLSAYRAEINVSSAPLVSIEDPTGGGAQALALIAGGVVTQVIPQQFGSGYTAPVVTLSQGTGTGATATAIVAGGLITGYTVTSGGQGFYQKQTPDVAFNLGMISWR